jgi:hypothetical protein
MHIAAYSMSIFANVFVNNFSTSLITILHFMKMSTEEVRAVPSYIQQGAVAQFVGI